MSFLSDIEKVRNNTFMSSVFGILGLLSPGTLVIFYYQRYLFLNLDFSKLLLLIVAYIVPFLSFNTYLSFGLMDALRGRQKIHNNDFWYVGMMSSLLLTSLIFYVTLAISFIFKFYFSNAIILACLLEFVLIILSILLIKTEKGQNDGSKGDRT